MDVSRPTLLRGDALSQVTPSTLTSSSILFRRQQGAELNAFVPNRFGKQRSRSYKKKRQSEPSLNLEALSEVLDIDFYNLITGEFKDAAEYINKLCETITQIFPDQLDCPEFFEELCKKMLILLKCEWEGVRAGVFHVLRRTTFQQKNLVFMLTNHVDIYAVRALDIVAENRFEREAAFQLLARMLEVYRGSPQLKQLVNEARLDPTKTQYFFPKSVMQPVVSIALRQLSRIDEGRDREDDVDDDPLSLPCVSLFLELAVCERELVVEMAGTDWIVASLTGTSPVSSSLATLIARVLVLWLDDPAMRSRANLHLVLEQIFAPLVEYGFFQTSNLESKDQTPLELPLEKYSRSFLAIMRSWSGLLCCASVNASGEVMSGSPFRLLDYLGVGTVVNENLLKIRDMVVDIACEFVDRPYANSKFSSWSEALKFYSQMACADSFRCSLRQDFVIAEAEMLEFLRPNATEHMDFLIAFRSVAAFALISAGLPQSLARLIVSHPDDPSALKATLLLSDICFISSTFIPVEWRSAVISLPTLVQSAAETIVQSNAARAVNNRYNGENLEPTFLNAGNAMLVLYRIDELTKMRLASCPKLSPLTNYALFMASDRRETMFNACELSSLSSTLSDALAGSSPEPAWPFVIPALNCIMKDLPKASKQSGEKIYNLVAKIFSWFSPSSANFESANRRIALASKRAVQLALMMSSDEYFAELLTKFASECFFELGEERLSSGAFALRKLTNSGNAFFFALLGAMSCQKEGLDVLERTGLLQRFNSLMNERTPVEYVKAIISCLDYTQQNSRARLILTRGLTAAAEQARKWCTRFLDVLISIPDVKFAAWGTKLLVAQLGDKSPKVVRHGVRIILLNAHTLGGSLRLLQTARFDQFGEAGVLLRAALFGEEDHCKNEAEVVAAIRYWTQLFNTRYAEIVDEDMRIALLGVRRTISGEFARSTQERFERQGVRAMPHLLGELARHQAGRNLLHAEAAVDCVLEHLADDDVAVVKGAILALGQIGASDPDMLPAETAPQLIRLAEQSDVLSVRGCAFFALCLVGSTKSGASAVAHYGWESSRHRSVLEDLRAKHVSTERPASRSTRQHTLNTELMFTMRIERAPSVNSSESATSTATPRRLRSRSLANNIEDKGAREKRKSAPNITATLSPEFRSLSPNSPRTERALTVESAYSAYTSVIGSFSEDGKRRLTISTSKATEDEEERESRSSTLHTIASADKSTVEVELESFALSEYGGGEHFSSKNRAKWRLHPLKVRKYIEVYKSVGHPVRYNLMTKEQLVELGQFAKEQLDDDHISRELELISEMPPPDNYLLPYITLPAEINLMCRSVFETSKVDSLLGENVISVEDRGAKSGYGRVRLENVKPHDNYRCFYCTLPEDSRPPISIGADAALLRREVLGLIDLLEIKRTLPEKKLLRLKAFHPWLFSWPCLYADVLEMLDQYRFKVRSRSFLQEIFYAAMRI